MARGRDGGAERIIALARDAGVRVVEDPPLAALLDAGGQVGDIIPVWCWEAAAKLLAFVAARNPESTSLGRLNNPVHKGPAAKPG